MSRYTNFDIAYKRLSDEYDKYGNIIVAFDVDSTVLPFHADEAEDNYLEIRTLKSNRFWEGLRIFKKTILFYIINIYRYYG